MSETVFIAISLLSLSLSLVSIEEEADSLQHPVRDVLLSVEIGLEH